MNNDYLLEYLDTQKTAITYESYIYEIVGESGYKIPKKARGGLIKGKPKLAKRGWK